MGEEGAGGVGEAGVGRGRSGRRWGGRRWERKEPAAVGGAVDGEEERVEW